MKRTLPSVGAAYGNSAEAAAGFFVVATTAI